MFMVNVDDYVGGGKEGCGEKWPTKDSSHLVAISRIQFLIGRSRPLVECLTEKQLILGPALSDVSGLCSAGLVLGENAF